MTEQFPFDNRIRTSVWQGAWSNLPTLALPDKTVVIASDHLQALLALKSHVQTQGELLLAADGRLDAGSITSLKSEGFSILRGLGTTHQSTERPEATHTAERGIVWLVTSGSTGRPKRVMHTLDSLTTVTSAQPVRRWLCAYNPGSYAWWQVVTLMLRQEANDLVCVDASELDRWPDVALEHGVTAISGTPTFWRQALWRDGPAVQALPLEQITLGGEPVDQAVLDQLRRLHPSARVSWIYASSEAGAAIAVHDGLAGFPAEWLDKVAPGRPRISIVDDELILSSPYAAAGKGKALRTGDRVEVADGRVRIVGRVGSDEINVGGSKASAGAIRETLLTHDAVAWARVRSRNAPIVGEVVVADVVLSRDVTEADLRSYLSLRLPDYAVPRKIATLTEIPIRESLKSDV